jgi:hypothetical protein
MVNTCCGSCQSATYSDKDAHLLMVNTCCESCQLATYSDKDAHLLMAIPVV